MDITEYADKNGIYSFSEKEFNPVDGLVLSQLSYLKFEGVIPSPTAESDGVLISSIMESEKYEQLYRDERYAVNNRKFFETLSESVRFGNLKANNFIDAIDDSLDIQFSAMTVTDGADFRCVVFRGTDDNMVGWKEDLNMTFKIPIPAQKYSVEYLNKVAKLWDGDFYVCGHSKGGNLAVYSAMNCEDGVRDRIKLIYSFDGPGFRTELLRNSSYDKVKEKIHKLVPQDCVIGMFGNAEKIEVVKCEGLGGVIQHNPFNWVVDEFDFERTEHMGRYSELRAEAVCMWASEMTDEQWALLSDKLFEVLDDAGVTNLNSFYDDFFGTLSKVKKSADKLDDDTKHKIKEMLDMFKETAAVVAQGEAKGSVSSAEKNINHARSVTHKKAQMVKGIAVEKVKTAHEKIHNAKDTKHVKHTKSKYTVISGNKKK